jgi:predicted HicB family RNase H-like nuclease
VAAYTEAQKRAIIKYQKEHTDNIQMRFPKGTKDRWQAAAAAAGVSMTQFVKLAVDEAIARQEKNC